MSPKEWERKADEQIKRNDLLLDANGMVLNHRQAPQYRHFSPRAMGVLDALDQMPCRPSMYYCRTSQRTQYIIGYISVKPADVGAKVAGGMHDITEDDIQAAFDELHEEALAVDEAQANECDWRM